MRFRTTVHLTLSLLLAGHTAVASASAAGEPTSADAPRHFQLSALYMSRPSLTRAEIDPSAVQIGPQPAPGAAKTIKVPPVAPNLVKKPAIDAAAKSPKITVPGLQPEPNADQPDTSYLKEYNVDWSNWISAHADRWYYNLKFTEEMFGVHFVTPRAAMIQFTCYADGSIRNVVLKQSSGVPAYDRLQIETLMATMPIAPFPRGTQRTAITLCQGWESHPREAGESDFEPGSFGRDFPKERVQQWCAGR